MKGTMKWVTSLALTMVLLTAAQLYANDRTLAGTAGELRPVKSPVVAKAVKACCIAGTYKGTHTGIPSANCKPIQKGETTFTMVIQQATCGSPISGTITDAAGAVMRMRGTVSVSGKCCLIKGVAMKSSGKKGLIAGNDSIRFQATLCKSGGKWVCKDGRSLNMENGCKGTFTLDQI